MHIMKKILRRIPLTFHYRKKRKQLRNDSFTLLSQNCVGGVMYNILGLPFQSPTINMFIEDENFVKLIENPKYYFSLPAKIINNNYIDPVNPEIHYPIIGVADIQVCCLHYNSGEEAVIAWERRRKRINYDKIYVIGNSWNLHESKELIYRVANCEYPSIVFTYNEYDSPNCISLPQEIYVKDSRGIVRPDLTEYAPSGYIRNFEYIFDYVAWLNDK